MTWIALKNYYDHEVLCPNCRGEDTERFVLTDDAGTVNYVMDRHLECGWEEIYMPELLGLVEGRKMNRKDRFYNFIDRVKAYLGIEGMNPYEILGRAVVATFAGMGVLVFAGTLREGVISVATEEGEFNIASIMTVVVFNGLGLYTFFRVFNRPTNKKEK